MADKKHIKLRGMIGLDDNATPEFLERELAEANGGPVQIDINSPGGFVYDGLEMANMVRRHPGHVTATVTGLAASMASYIPMMADTVEVEDNTVFMIHNPFFAIFKADYQIAEKWSAELKATARLLGKGYVDKTGKSVEAIAQLMDAETLLFGDEIVAEGFADIVVKGESEGDKTKALAFAQGEIKACEELLKDAGKPVQYEKIAALMGGVPKTTEKKTMAELTPTPEAPAPVTLQAFLAANPEAKTEHEQMVAKARTEGSPEGKILAALDVGLPILASAEYPEGIKKRVAAQIRSGNIEGMKDFIALHDTQVEASRGKMAEGSESPDETRPEGPKASADTYEDKKQRIRGA